MSAVLRDKPPTPNIEQQINNQVRRQVMAEGYTGRELRKRAGRLRLQQEQPEESGQAAIRRQRQSFEQELRAYTGEDPLDVWDRYLAWVLQTYPKGGKESQLYELLQRAVLQFSNEKRYHDDARYVNLWIKLAQNSTVPVDTFGDMQAEGVGLTHAALYVAWATEFEKRGDFQKAVDILQEGLKRGAQPVDDLHQHHLALQAQASSGAAQGVPAEDEPTSPLRTSMVNLRPRGRRKTGTAANKTHGTGHSRGLNLEAVSDPASVLHEDSAGPSVASDAKTESTGREDHQLQPGAEHSQPQEEGGGAKEQSMYCKDLVTNGIIEYSFEELRAERFFQRQREAYDDKNRHLAEVKQRLEKELEDKQKLLLLRQNQSLQDGPTPAMELERPPKRAKTFQIFEESQPGPDSTQTPRNPSALQNETCDDVFLRHGEKGLSLRVVYPTRGRFLPNSDQAHTSQDLPEGTVSLSEEAIVFGHQNKTLCSSPDDTRDFVGAAKIASTPCPGLLEERTVPSEVGGLTEDLRALTRTTFAGSQHRDTHKKLSPIEEGSREAWSSMASASLSSLGALSGSKEGQLSPLEESHQGPDMMDTTPDDAPREGPCSLEARKRLLDQINFSGFSNFHPQPTPVPTVEEDSVLMLGDQIFLIRSKVVDGENFSIYTASTQEGNVVMKVEFSTLPWDFYIGHQLRERLAADPQASTHPSASCYAFSDGCVTVYHVSGRPRIIKMSHELSLASSAARLIELVRSLHSCGLLLGAPPARTLLHYYTNRSSSEVESVLPVDLSSAVDLRLQTDVTAAQQLPSASPFISQGVLEPSTSPYQVDLLFVAETVHTLLTQRSMSLLKDDSGWMVEEYSDAKPSGWRRQLWGKFFHSILNSSDRPSVSVLSELRDMLSAFAA